LFYADLLLRRAGQPTDDSTRVRHLERLIERYLANPGNYRFSAERVSQTAYNAEPGALGDNSASSHLQGELLGAVLDLAIRDATNGRRSMDDVMPLLLERFSAERGFIGRDIEASVEDVCACDVTPIFDAHVRGAGKALDFDRYLGLIGLRARVTSTRAMMPNGDPVVDLRIYARDPAGGGPPRLVVSNAESIWSQAGLHTGDEVISVNGAPTRSWPDFRTAIRGVRIGQRVRVEVNRPTGRYTATVVVAGFDRPVVHLEEMPGAREKARGLRAAWLAAR
jgi:predicted metalloprotease with PDZ domain